jgi:hypothetical protein
LAAKLIAQKIKAAKGKKQFSPDVENILLGLQKLVAKELAKNTAATISADSILASNDPISETNASIKIADSGMATLDSISNFLSDPMKYPTHIIKKGNGKEHGGHMKQHKGYSNDDGKVVKSISSFFKDAFSAAKQKTDNLSDPADQQAATAQLNSLQQDIQNNSNLSNNAVSAADPQDLADVSSALSSCDSTATAASVADPQADPPVAAPADEKKALSTTSVNKPFLPAWAWWTIAGVTVATVGYYYYAHHKKKHKK